MENLYSVSKNKTWSWLWLRSWAPYCNKWNESHSVMSDSLQPHGLYSPWNSPGQNTGVGSFSHLQGIFPTHRSNPGLLQCRWILYQLSHKGSPRILELVAYPSSSGSSWPRNRTRGSCIAGRFFTNWGIREIATFRLKLKKVGKITRPFRYDLNQPLMIIQWRWWIDSRY